MDETTDPIEHEEPEPETDAGDYYLELYAESAEDYRRNEMTTAAAT